MKYTIKTTISEEDGVIYQTVEQDAPLPVFDNLTWKQSELLSWVWQSREKGIHEALVKMGWTPPPEKQAEPAKYAARKGLSG